jgi:ABC-type dipeptide/oligopeptide/nickel transport system permease component
MLPYIVRRLLWTLPVLLVATTLAFLVLHLIPGDPVNLMLAGRPASETVRENLRRNLGLDRPVHERYLHFITHAVRGDFGISFRTRERVIQVIARQLPASLELALGGMVIGVTTGMSLDLIAGLRPNTYLDGAVMFVALLGISLPGYWTAMMLIYLFGLKLGWVPIVASGGLTALILPSIVVGSFAIGDIARLVRASIVEIRTEDYIRTAQAKGLPERRVVLHHALRNALIPVVTLIGLQLGLFVGGGVITETVFARQGVGSLLVGAILEKDYPVVQAVILLTTGAYVFANLAVDVVYALLDPRIRYA